MAIENIALHPVLQEPIFGVFGMGHLSSPSNTQALDKMAGDICFSGPLTMLRRQVAMHLTMVQMPPKWGHQLLFPPPVPYSVFREPQPRLPPY